MTKDEQDEYDRLNVMQPAQRYEEYRKMKARAAELQAELNRVNGDVARLSRPHTDTMTSVDESCRTALGDRLDIDIRDALVDAVHVFVLSHVNASAYCREQLALAIKPRPMSEAPRVWSGPETHITADVWKFGWTPTGYRWMGAHHRLSTGMIFVPMQYTKPTIDPADIDSLTTCSKVDWLPASGESGA